MMTERSRTDQESSRNFTLRLAQGIQSVRYEDLPDEIKELGKQCILDWVGVALAGSDSHLVHALLRQALAEGGHPMASVIGHSQSVASLQAALINGAGSHILDYDDVSTLMLGHPTAPILSALLALGQTRRSSGRELITAFVAGYELACRVGSSVEQTHYERGYHATSTLGVLGAAAGCAHLLQLDAHQTAHAIAIAATQAAGLRAMFGTECKALHAGLAAQNGLRAAQLAALGVVARTDSLECRTGFAATMSPAFDPDAAFAQPKRFHIRDNLFKYHASCYGTHPPIECILKLRDAHSITAGEVERAVIRGGRGQDTICNIQEPRTALEAKFSLRFMTAAALAGADTSDLAFFTDARTADPYLCSLRDKMFVELQDGWPTAQGEVTVQLKDGRVLTVRHDASAPAADIAQQGLRLARKFGCLAEPVIGASRCQRLQSLVLDLEAGTVEEIMNAARVVVQSGDVTQ